MKPKDDLFRLIKSLSQGEKRQLKLLASSGSQNKNYLQLFDAIEKMDEYDEQKIKKKFTGKALARHLPSEKNYLQSGILKMLRNHPGESVMQELMLDAAEVEVLFSKGLYDRALERAYKSFLEAEECDHLGIALTLLMRERTIFLATDRVYAMARAAAWEKDYERLLEKQENLLAIMKVGNRMAEITMRKGAMLTAEQIEECRQLVHTGVMEDISNAKSGFAMSTFIAFRLNYYSAASDLVNGLKYARMNVDFYSERPKHVKRAPQNFFGAMSTLINYLFATNQLKEARMWLERLAAYPDPFDFRVSPSVEQFKLRREIPLRMDLLIREGNEQLFRRDVAGIREILRKKKLGDDELHTLEAHFSLANLFFTFGDYREAIREFTRVEEYGTKELVRDYKTLARILIVLSHTEKGTTDVAAYLYKKFKLHNLKGVEKLVADFICKKLPYISSGREVATAVSDFKKEYVAQAEHQGIERYFEFTSWAESKIQRKTMGEIMRAKSLWK